MCTYIDPEAERKAAIRRQIQAKKEELNGVNSEIEKYEAIKKTLNDSNTSIGTYESTLTSSLFEAVDTYDVKGGTQWLGLRATVGSNEVGFIRNKKTEYAGEITTLKTNISDALEAVEEKLKTLYARKEQLEKEISDLESQL